MRDTDSTGTKQEQTNNNEVKTPLAVPGTPITVRDRLLIILSLLSLYFVWGGTYLGIRIALQSYPPFILAGVRQLSAGILLYIFLRIRKNAPPTRSQWLAAILVGGLFGRWPTRIEWFGLGLGFVGLVLLNLENGLHANPIGAIALLIAPMSWGFGSMLSQRLPLPKGLMASAAQMLAGGSMLMILGLSVGERVTSFPALRPLGAMAFLVVGGSLVAFSAYGYLLRRVRPALATSYAYVNPVVAVGLGVALAGEQITLIELLAMLTILSGVGLVSLGRDRR